MAVYPPQHFNDDIKRQIVTATEKLAVAIKCIGMINIQFIVHNHEVYILEVNPRASRTVPFLSKITGIEMAQVATRVILGQSLCSIKALLTVFIQNHKPFMLKLLSLVLTS